MSHEGRRFFYRVQHCDFNWRPTEGLFSNEYIEANQEDIWIDKGTESQNTTTLYTHYRFNFPNAEVKPLISGNYLLTIYDDSSDKPEAVAEVRLRIVEPLVGISGRVLTNTDIDWNAAHQQIEMEVKAEGLAGDLRFRTPYDCRANGRSDMPAVDVLQPLKWATLCCGNMLADLFLKPAMSIEGLKCPLCAHRACTSNKCNRFPP